MYIDTYEGHYRSVAIPSAQRVLQVKETRLRVKETHLLVKETHLRVEETSLTCIKIYIRDIIDRLPSLALSAFCRYLYIYV